MARQAGTFVENKFIRGLITERTALSFPTDACTETWNCVFDETGKVTRRRGIDLESSHSASTVTATGGDAYAEFTWDQVGSDADLSFFVQQVGSVLHFYDIESSTTLGGNKASFTLDLSTYAEGSAATNIRGSACDFTQGTGKLFVVNRYMTPIVIAYDAIGGTISATEIVLQIRDTEGLDDGLDLNERPSTLSGDHTYNLYNQGWTLSNPDSLTQWDTARSDYPSNADQVAFSRGSTTDAFDNSILSANTPGNTPAPRGHFIMNVGLENRDYLNFSSLGTGFPSTTLYPLYRADLETISPYLTKISEGLGSTIGDFTNAGSAFNGDKDIAVAETHATATGTSMYIGKNFGTGKKISAVYLHALSDANPISVGPVTNYTVAVYGSNSSPSNGTDGTELTLLNAGGTNASMSSNLSYRIDLADWSTEYQYVWLYFTYGSSTTFRFAEIEFYEPTYDKQYPSRVEFFAGRLFYTGYNYPGIANRVYFTQIIEREDQYGKCYQAADPTSEQISDLVSTDGGVVNIPDMSQVYALQAFQNQILLLAKNGVWVLTGSGGPFSATGYAVRKISGVGMNSPQSVVDVRGVPVWWGEDGIYTVDYDANYESATVKSLTEDTIKQFILDIPALNRTFVKGTYDRLQDIAYWMFNDDASLDSTEYWTYNKVLCINVKTGAFYPWELNLPSETPLTVHGIHYLQDGDRADNFVVKYTVSYDQVTTTRKLNYAQEYKTTYKDWADYATVTTDADDEEDYTSYFISGYRLDGEGLKHFQGNYVYPFLERETDASVYVQGIYDFTESANSGRWSSPQRITSQSQTYRTVRRYRLKIRGKGESLQLRYYSETGKPFTLIGWGVYASANQHI